MKDDNAVIFEDKDELQFLEEEIHADEEKKTFEKINWNILIADDEEQVHAVTKLAAKDIEFLGRKINFHSVYSAESAKKFLKNRKDIAVILLDVIMESDQAGLELVNYIRNELSNNSVRIILRTGMPGMVPENDVIIKYDINDYKTKSELTAQKLFTSLISGLRSYNDIMTINRQKRDMTRAMLSTKLLMNSVSLYGACHTLIKAFFYFFNNTDSPFSFNDAIHSGFCGIIKKRENYSMDIITGTGFFSEGFETTPELLFSDNKKDLLIQAIDEKNEIIKNGFYCCLYSLSNFTEIIICIDYAEINTAVESTLLKMFNSSVKMSLETALLIDTLDIKVREKTENISDLLNNSNQGFLSFGSDFKICPEFSKKCIEIFEKEINGDNALELIYRNNIITNYIGADNNDNDEVSCIKKIIECCFVEKERIKIYFRLLPEEVTLKSKNKTIRIKYVFLQNSSRIMLILTDITNEKILMNENRLKKEKNDMLIKFAIDKSGFIQFIKDSRGRLANLIEKFPDSSEKNRNLRDLLLFIHTMKGNASFFDLNYFTESAEHVENMLQEILIKDQDNVNIQSLKGQIVTLLQALEQNIGLLSDCLDTEIFNCDEHFFEISEKRVNELIFLIQEFTIDSAEKIKMMNVVKSFGKNSIYNFLTRHAASTERLADRLNKKISFKFTNCEMPVNYYYLKPVLETLCHIFRNAVYHGIESPEIRKSKNKPETGVINVKLSETQNSGVEYFNMKISDDGSGICAKEIQKKIIEKKIMKPEIIKGLSDEEIILFIFREDFSTVDDSENSDISGRGVGLTAVKKEVENLKGNISIKTEPEKGFEINITIPYEK